MFAADFFRLPAGAEIFRHHGRSWEITGSVVLCRHRLSSLAFSDDKSVRGTKN
jgi:hypothetical protein